MVESSLGTCGCVVVDLGDYLILPGHDYCQKHQLGNYICVFWPTRCDSMSTFCECFSNLGYQTILRNIWR